MSVGATTSILVHEIRERGIPITPLEATVMLLGIHEDTGSLTYPGTTAYDAEAAAFLMASGAEMEVLNQFLSRALTPAQRVVLDSLLDTLEVWDIHGQEVAVGWASAEEYIDSASVLTHYICEDLGYRVAIALVAMPERAAGGGSQPARRRGHRRGAQAHRRRRAPAGGGSRAARRDGRRHPATPARGAPRGGLAADARGRHRLGARCARSTRRPRWPRRDASWRPGATEDCRWWRTGGWWVS